MRLPICGMIAGALLVLAQPAAADDADTCTKASGDVAIAACSRAIASMRYNGHQLAVLYNNRGAEHQRKGDADLAITDHNEAIRFDPKYAKAHNNRGNAQRLKVDLDGSIADLAEAIRLDPKYASPYYNRGLTWEIKGNKDRAIADHTEASRLGNTNAAARLKALGR